MRTLILIALFLQAMAGMAVAQQVGMPGLAASLEQYKRAVIDQKIDEVMSFIYPGTFKVMPQKQVRKGIEERYANGAAPKIKQIDFLEIGSPKAYSKGQYTVIKYHVAMQMPRPGDATPEIDAFVTKMMKDQLGDKVKVTIDEHNSLVNVALHTHMLVVNEGNQGWKMIEKDHLAWLVREQALPEDLAKSLP